MHRSARVFFMVPVLLICAIVSSAQKPAEAKRHAEVPTLAPRPDDVSSINGIVKAFYEVISGPAGKPRQWSRDRTLYIRDIRFVAMSEDKTGHPVAHVVSHQQFVDATDPEVVKEGFYESEIHRVTQTFGHIAHVMSTYETRVKAGGPVTERGINSMELFNDGKRWWIASVIWDDERPNNPVPLEFVPKKDSPNK